MKIHVEFDGLEDLENFVRTWKNLIPLREDELIESLGLDNRSKNCLLNAGITTIKELIDRTPNDLLKEPNLGRRSLNEIQVALQRRGMKMRDPRL